MKKSNLPSTIMEQTNIMCLPIRYKGNLTASSMWYFLPKMFTLHLSMRKQSDKSSLRDIITGPDSSKEEVLLDTHREKLRVEIF